MKYLVRNSRPRRIVTVHGRILPAEDPSVGCKAGEIWLTEAQFQHPRVQRLVEIGRLAVVRSVGSEPQPAAPAPTPAPAPKPEPAPEPEPAPVPEPEVEEPAEEPVEEPEEDESDDSDGAAVVQADGDIVPESDADEEGAHSYTEEELSALTLPFIRPIAKKLGIEPKGKKADIITAILEAQG